MAKVDKTTLVERVTDLLRKYIDTEEMQAGDKMPGEIELCERYQVSRTTIREALRLLQAYGYVQLIPNKGVFVIEKNRRGVSALNAWIMEHADEMSDIFEVRMLLEPYATALAVQRATTEEKYMIIGANAMFNEAVTNNNLTGMVLYDEHFHECIMKASHNAFIVELNKLISEVSRGYRRQSFAADSDTQLAKDTHGNLVNAIMAGDSDLARKLMEEHLKTNIKIIEQIKEKK